MLSFARDRHAVSQWLKALAFVLPVVVLSATALELSRARLGAIQATEMQMARLDMVMAEQTGRTMETLDQILRSTADTVELLQANNVPNLDWLDDTIRRRIDGLGQIAGVAVADPAGRLLISTMPGMTAGLQARAEAMIAATGPTGPVMQIGKPFRDGAGPFLAMMIRRIAGTPGGYAVGFINLRFFEDFYESVQLSENGAIALHLRDGTVLARYPHIDSVIGTSFAELPPFKDVLAKAVAGTLEMTSPVDGTTRVLAIRALPSFPLAVNISVVEAEVLRAWTNQAAITGALVLLACLVICGLLLLLAKRAQDREALALVLAEAKDAALAAGRKLAGEMAERARAEDALRKAQRIEALGQLTGGVAHDFNNLLTVVLSNLEMLDQSGHCQGESGQMLDNARAAAERGATMTGQLLAFSRQQPLRPAPVDLRRLLHGMMNLLHSALGGAILLNMRLLAQTPAMADANQLELVVLNLALNARDAMPDGGTLTIATQDVTRAAPEGPEQPAAGPYVLIEIRDTGTGMSPDVRGRAFDPFFTTKGPGAGSGLGLSQVYGVARQSGGLAELESTPHVGTVVRVWLPRADALPVTVADRPAEPLPSFTTKSTILVVDDDEAVRDATVRMLRRCGYDVLENHSAEPALRRLAGGEAVDLVLSDIVMPGMSGLDLARAVRKLRPSLPFVFISGYADLASLSADLGQLRLIRKPFRSSELIKQIEAALASAPTALLALTVSN
jgi:signal transduction histidine kinase/ActR/RegA family two-component response regulator